MDTLYVNKPGGVIVHTVDGGSERLGYGDPVPVDRLADYVNPRAFADDQRRLADDSELQRLEASRRAALTENGQVNSSSSPVPGNYRDLDEDAAAQLVSNLASYPEAQAAVVLHEILHGGNRQKVVDAAGSYAQQSAQIQIAQLSLKSVSPEPYGAPVTGFGDPAVTDPHIIQERAGRVDLSGPTRTPAPTSGNGDGDGDVAKAPDDYSGFSYDALKVYIDQHELDVPKNQSADNLREGIAAQPGHERPQTPPAS